MINKNCNLCGNESGYTEESLETSTHNINGIEVVVCCYCEDDLIRNVLSKRVTDSTYEQIEKETGLVYEDEEC